MAKSVRILNPLPGTARRTSPKRAERYVAEGRAHFVAGKKHLLFVGDDYRNTMVLSLLALEQAIARESAIRNESLDRAHRQITRMLTREEVRHIPFLQADQAFILSTRPRRSTYRNGKVRVVTPVSPEHARTA